MSPTSSIHPETPTGLALVADRCNEWLRNHQRLYLFCASVLCALTFSGYAHTKFPWVDEVIELTITRLGGARAIWAALMDGVQIDPPVMPTALHYLFRLTGENVFLARTPAILGFTLVCLCLSLLVWRYAPPVYAAASFFLPYATVMRVWAMDVRPYGAMFGLSALTLLCWDAITTRRNSMRWRVAFTLALAFTFSTHFYSILLLIPLACGELAKKVWMKAFDWLTMACIAVALIPYALWSPILLSGARHFMRHYFSSVKFDNLATFYSWAIASLPLAGILLFLLLGMAIAGRVQPERVESTALSGPYRVLLAVVAGLLLIPIVGFAAGVLRTGFFVPYYHVLSAFGVVLGIPLLLNTIGFGNRTVGLLLATAALGWGLFVSMRGLTGFLRHESPYPTVAEIRSLIPEQKPDIVIPSPMTFLPLHNANRLDTGNNLLYLFDPTKAAEESGTNTSELVLSLLRGRTTARIEPYESYTAGHRHFYMAVLGETKGTQEWQVHYLQTRGHARFWWLGKIGDFDVFRVDLPTAADGQP